MTDDQLNEMRADLARLEGKVDSVIALHNAAASRARDEITALFAGRREHAEKIEAIRIDYVRAPQFTAHVDQNRADHAEFSKQIAALTAKVMVASGAVSLAAFLAGLLVRMFGGLR
ncbi:MAG: hypothetical protein U1A27_00145 [Phycisphaerae bacterium]